MYGERRGRARLLLIEIELEARFRDDLAQRGSTGVCDHSRHRVPSDDSLSARQCAEERQICRVYEKRDDNRPPPNIAKRVFDNISQYCEYRGAGGATEVVFYREEDGSVPLLDWLEVSQESQERNAWRDSAGLRSWGTSFGVRRPTSYAMASTSSGPPTSGCNTACCTSLAVRRSLSYLMAW